MEGNLGSGWSMCAQPCQVFWDPVDCQDPLSVGFLRQESWNGSHSFSRICNSRGGAVPPASLPHCRWMVLPLSKEPSEWVKVKENNEYSCWPLWQRMAVVMRIQGLKSLHMRNFWSELFRLEKGRKWTFC